MATQITFVGGERIGVTQSLEEVVQALKPESPGASTQLTQLTREDGTSVHVNPAHVLYVRTVQ
jgi:uncharacterized protein YlzI (FlbEa/FlbD family)